MPFIKILRKLPVFVCYLLLAITLSGCSAIGTNKPAALQVSTVPEASIFLDGKHLGKTPFYSDQLKAGTHTLKIAASEANYVAQIDLRESTLTVINRQLATNYLAQAGEILTLEPAKSGFLVLSSPSGASLVVDGKLQGQTPALVENIAEGEHKVEISKEGYLQRQFAIKIAKNYQLQAQVTLASEVARGPIP
ncbi:PEGA domain-containing protein, partial [Candidatus Curtissbacteria bacterium]|nr:PEGA domain-containing protein [Candidatus Curtissbacteria bacterium]